MRKLLFLIFSIGIQFCFPQSNKNVAKGLFKLNALSPGASYELGVGKNATFNFGATVVAYIEEEFQNGFFGQSEGLVLELYPVLRSDFRYFVNMKRRLRKGKDITRNSGNYVALENQMIMAVPILGQIELDEPLGYSFRLAYGIQRTYGKGFYWGLGFGIGATYLDNTLYNAPVLTTHLGWVISKSKK